MVNISFFDRAYADSSGFFKKPNSSACRPLRGCLWHEVRKFPCTQCLHSPPLLDPFCGETGSLSFFIYYNFFQRIQSAWPAWRNSFTRISCPAPACSFCRIIHYHKKNIRQNNIGGKMDLYFSLRYCSRHIFPRKWL